MTHGLFVIFIIGLFFFGGGGGGERENREERAMQYLKADLSFVYKK